MKRKRKTHKGLLFILSVILLVTGILLYGVINSKTVRVVYGTATLKNLDYRLDGVKILYLSDLKISNGSEAADAVKLIKKLNALSPDLILLGGDISGDSLINDLRVRLGILRAEDVQRGKKEARDQFLLDMNEINAKYGIYAVLGDGDLPLTQEERARSNIRFLYDETVYVNIDGAALPLYGEYSGNNFRLGTENRGAMVVLFHDPSGYKTAALKASERSSDADSYLFLSAHLLGGQMRIGNRFAYLSEQNREFTANSDAKGLYSDGSQIRMLLSQGIGCEGLPLRYGSAPTAYLITLKRA
ncbi:MAG: hypothetical protein IJM56_05250 [Clostridia bacterium]|nr:hypothetical protein [Clostridia bacterium]